MASFGWYTLRMTDRSGKSFNFHCGSWHEALKRFADIDQPGNFPSRTLPAAEKIKEGVWELVGHYGEDGKRSSGILHCWVQGDFFADTHDVELEDHSWHRR